MADPGWAIDEDDAQALADEIVSQLARGVDVAYRLLSVSAANIASVPTMHAPMVRSIRSYLGDPDVQVVYDPLGLLDQISSPEAAEPDPRPVRAGAEPGDVPPRGLAGHPDDGAQQLRRPAAGPARGAGAGPVAGRPREGAAGPRPADRGAAGRLPGGVQPGRRPGRQHRLRLRPRARRGRVGGGGGADGRPGSSTAVHRRHPGGVEADRTELESLVREGLFHRESERRHLAAVVLSASPYAHARRGGRPRPAQRAGHRPAGARPDGDAVQLPGRRRAPAPAEPVRR